MEEHIHMEYETNLSQAFFRVTVAEPYSRRFTRCLCCKGIQ